MGVVGPRRKKVKVGVLGGTFDPVHRGHVMMAEEACKTLDLEEVLMVPAGQPVSRAGQCVTSAADRLAMVRLAAAGRPWLKVSTIEIERPGPSYTVDTIAALREQYGPTADFYFILGWDSLEQLPAWHEPARLVGLCRMVAVPRPGHPRPDMAALEKVLPGLSGRVVFLERPRVDISASAIREMVCKDKPIDHLVPEEVAAYIREHGLYRKSGGKR
jgi:nicotinate-nucleotide adenylyltransferase